MLHPAARTDAAAQAATLATLGARTGTTLTLIGSTRTGALDLAVGSPLSDAGWNALAQRLRTDRSVLWAQPAHVSIGTKARASRLSIYSGRKLLVRLRDSTAPDWPALTAAFTVRLGVPVAVERAIGPVWVLALAQARSGDRLAELAEALQDDPAVQYADPVLPNFRTVAVVPNDPLFPLQWALTDPVTGINAPAAWALETGSASTVIGVVDTGILPHPDLAGRVVPGYDFIFDATPARDGNSRDPDPKDEGDWTSDGDCGFAFEAPSSWHGTRVAGLIAANTENELGIAGVNWNAKILPVRVLGQCGGTDEDVYAGLIWAAGAAIGGIPLNQNPAKVINMSLGRFGDCAQAIQQAVDDAMAQGAVVVAAAGNDSENALGFTPAGCNGVITVGAHNRSADRTFYSNFGSRVDISAPAGDGDSGDAMLSLSNDGPTTPGNPIYDEGIGTSFSAPLVAGTASLMLARNPTLTPGQVLSLMQSTARSFFDPSPCRLGNLCGIGMLDAAAALAATFPATATAPPNTVPVVEYYNAALDHYFITAASAEIQILDTAPGAAWQRTGYVFYAYDAAHAPPWTSPVCRFYANAEVQIESHFFTASATECQYVLDHWPGIWQLETPSAFYIEVPDAAGHCPAGSVGVHRFFNNRRDANHRFTIDLSVSRMMTNRAWSPEGNGDDAVVFCSPI